MIREKLLRKEPPVRNGFRLRGTGEVSRVEALSDGVIAFAITLLAGMSYWLIGPVLFLHGLLAGKRRKRLQQRLSEEAGEAIAA